MNTPTSTLETLGQRLRRARHERGMSQEMLAKPEYTKSYVSAVERGKARPSLKALELMARRLQLPMTDLLAVPVAAIEEPDLVALDAALQANLDQVALQIDAHRAEDALRLAHAAAAAFADHLDELPDRTHYRLHLLRAQAHLQVGEPGAARLELTAAQALAGQMNDPEAAERARDLAGVAYYQQEMPRLALEQHELGLQAIRDGVVQEPSLRLSIFSHLARDYAALNEREQAIGLYEQAQDLLAGVRDLERQAGTYRRLSDVQHAEGDQFRAGLYAVRALNLSETARNLVTAAEMTTSLAALRVEQGALDEAAALLDQARTTLEPTGDRLVLSSVFEHQAALALAQSDGEAAARHAKRSLDLAEHAHQTLGSGADAAAQAATSRAYARALRMTGLVDERNGDPAAADQRFGRALDLLEPEGYTDTASEIELDYADLLAARGAHEQASAHYRAAFRHHQRLAGR